MIELALDGAEVEVTFSVPSECGAREPCLVGEFNEWSTNSAPDGA
jgi:hypothetical protein